MKLGTYQHYKGGKYRTLLVTKWYSDTPAEEGDIFEVNPDEGFGRFLYSFHHSNKTPQDYSNLIVRWSGRPPEEGQAVVLYASEVGIFGRTVAEFTESVEAPLGSPEVGTLTMPRFTFIQDWMVS